MRQDAPQWTEQLALKEAHILSGGTDDHGCAANNMNLQLLDHPIIPATAP
jgi:hypothetical protein